MRQPADHRQQGFFDASCDICATLDGPRSRSRSHSVAKRFRGSRIRHFLEWFETILAQNPKGDRYLVGARLSYADLSLFQAVAGLNYAFPKAMAKHLPDAPKVAALSDRIAARPRIKAYLDSDRRTPSTRTASSAAIRSWMGRASRDYWRIPRLPADASSVSPISPSNRSALVATSFLQRALPSWS